MRRASPLLLLTFCASLLLVGAASAARAQQPPSPGWKEFAYPANGFAITAPSQPTVENSKGTDEYTVDLGSDRVFMLGVINVAPEVQKTKTPQEILEAGLNGALSNANGKLISKTVISLAGNPGLRYEIEAEKYHLNGRLYYANGSAYMLLNICPIAQPYPAEGERIMESFRVFAPSAESAPGEWREFKYSQHGFAISSRLAPKIEDQKPANGVECDYTVELMDDQRIFMLSVWSVSADALKTRSADEILQKGLDAILAKPNTRQVSRTKISLQGNQGVEAELEMEKAHNHLRMYMVGDLIYLLQNLTLPGQPFDPDGERIMGSFRVFKPAQQ